MADNKQYILDYKGDVIYPYILEDCILKKDGSDTYGSISEMSYSSVVNKLGDEMTDPGIYMLGINKGADTTSIEGILKLDTSNTTGKYYISDNKNKYEFDNNVFSIPASITDKLTIKSNYKTPLDAIIDPSTEGTLIKTVVNNNVTYRCGKMSISNLDISSISDNNIYTIVKDSTGIKWSATNASVTEDVNGSQTTKYYLTGVDTSNNNSYNADNKQISKLKIAKNSTDTGIYFKDNALYQTSDEKLKTFISDIDINFDNLLLIKKGVFYWKNDPNKVENIGVGANSVEALYPEIVDDNDGVKTVSYDKLGVIALAAIDKLVLRIKDLEEEVKILKKEAGK